jgi:hypothetical protein
MARRMGTESKKSWALSHVHIAYIDDVLEQRYCATVDRKQQHDLACAGTINLLAYLGWLRSGEVFGLGMEDITLVDPCDGPARGLPPGCGAVEGRLLGATKSDQTLTADVVVAYTTLSGLSLGKWFARLATFDQTPTDRLFSTESEPQWSSRFFRVNYAYPILEMQRRAGEPSLSTFSNEPGNRMEDKIYSMHTWRRGGRSRVSRVSRLPRHNEPNPRGTRKASPTEVYEHGRWQQNKEAEDMPKRYNQWDLSDRILITLCCM